MKIKLNLFFTLNSFQQKNWAQWPKSSGNHAQHICFWLKSINSWPKAGDFCGISKKLFFVKSCLESSHSGIKCIKDPFFSLISLLLPSIFSKKTFVLSKSSNDKKKSYLRNGASFFFLIIYGFLNVFMYKICLWKFISSQK